MSAAANKIEEKRMADAKGFEPDVKVRTRDYKIGCVGAGMIMAECHLAAYKEAGFPVAAIASRTKANAEEVAKRWGIPKAHTTPDELIRDETIEILDVAYPPDQQPALIKLAFEQKHIKAIPRAKTARALWAEGEVRQAAVFGEDLCLVRRIEADVGGDEIRLSDRVVNRGFYRTPHMLFYHVNVGHPVLDEGARYLAPISDVVWASHAGDAYEKQKVGYRTVLGPQENFREQVWQHETAAARPARFPWPSSTTASVLASRSRQRKLSCHAFTNGSTFSLALMSWGSSRRRTTCSATMRRGSAAR
jgi:hypothetical protein